MTSLALACRLGAVTAPRSIPRRVRAILNKYGATMLLPGAAEPILGPELVGSAWVDASAAPATATFSSGVLTLNATGGTSRGRTSIPTVAGRTYRVTARKLNAGSDCTLDVGTSAGGSQISANNTVGTAGVSFTFVATTTQTWLNFYRGATSVTEVTDISVREILGYQNTYSSFIAGNYRESTGQTLAATDQQVGLVVDAARVPGEELLPAWSAGFSSLTNIGIGASAGTVNLVGAEIVMVSGDGSADRAEFTIGGLVAGRLYQARVTARRGSQGTSQNFSSWTVGTINRVSIDSTDNKEYVINFVASGTGGMIRAYAADISGGAIGDAVIVSSISVRELPGIHASQSTSGFQPVLRNTAGIQSWQFDGTDDRLSLSAVPFQMSDDPFCIVAFECGALGVNRSVIDLATSASSARFANLRINAIGQPQSVVVNDALSATLITAKEVSAGTKLVLAATTAEGVQKLYVDGAYAAEAVLSGTFTPTESYIGSRKGTSENFNGPIHCVIFGKGAISGAELLTLEKFAASLQGRSL